MWHLAGLFSRELGVDEVSETWSQNPTVKTSLSSKLGKFWQQMPFTILHLCQNITFTIILLSWFSQNIHYFLSKLFLRFPEKKSKSYWQNFKTIKIEKQFTNIVEKKQCTKKKHKLFEKYTKIVKKGTGQFLFHQNIVFTIHFNQKYFYL